MAYSFPTVRSVALQIEFDVFQNLLAMESCSTHVQSVAWSTPSRQSQPSKWITSQALSGRGARYATRTCLCTVPRDVTGDAESACRCIEWFTTVGMLLRAAAA